MIRRLFWLGVIAFASVAKFIATWLEEHAAAKLKNKPEDAS